MVKVGDRVVGQTSMGFWIRATMKKMRGDGSARARFGDFESPKWLPRTQGFGAEEEWLAPERMAPMPASAPSAPPAVGTDVIALWDDKRFHFGRVVSVEGSGKGARVDVRFDDAETLPFEVREVLAVLPPSQPAVRELEAKGLKVGVGVRMVDGEGRPTHAGWIARVGTGKVYVCFPKASHGHWLLPEHVKKGGGAKPRRPPKKSVGELAEGARVIARWTDGQLYPGMVGAVRRRKWDREARIHWDDGTVRWTPEGRVWVTAEAGEPVPQRRREEPVDEVRLSPGQPIAARARDGYWRRGRVAVRHGGDVFVQFEAIPTKRGDKQRTWPGVWARGRQLALPPSEDERSFPAKGAFVLAVKRRKERHGVLDLTFEAGRAKKALGDRLEVQLDGGVSEHFVFDDVWTRDPKLAATEAELETRADVLVVREPDVRAEAVVLQRGRKKREGLYEVRYDDGQTAWVDAARIELAPEPPPPPPPPPEPEPEPEPAPPPDPRRALLVGLLTRWSGTGTYRNTSIGALLDDDERGARLPVDVGLLSVRIERPFVIDLTAATGTGEEPLPPPNPPMVRMASWVKSFFAGPTDPEEGDRLDEAWAAATFGEADVDRAGGAITVRIRCGSEPTPGELAGWARAVHERLFDRED